MKLRMNSYSIENWRETSKHFLQQAKTPISLRQKHVISMCDDIFLSEEHTVLVGGGGCEAEGSLAELFVPWHVFIRATRQAADSSAGLRRAGVPGGFHAARKLWSVLWSIPITMSCSLSPPTVEKKHYSHTPSYSGKIRRNVIHDLSLPDDGNVTTDHSLSLLSNCCYAFNASCSCMAHMELTATSAADLPSWWMHFHLLRAAFFESDAKVSLLSTNSTTPDCL